MAGIAWELTGSQGLTPDLPNKNLHFTITPSQNFIKILGRFYAYSSPRSTATDQGLPKIYLLKMSRDFCGGPMVKTPCFCCMGLIPGWGTKISHAV